MTQCGQVLYSLANPVEIVDADIGNPGDIWSDVDEDKRNLAITQVFNE